jgi:hypothetical protein
MNLKQWAMENGHGKGSQREGEDRLPGGTNYLGRERNKLFEVI